MFNYNKDLMIIDTTATMEYNNHVEELWLDPSNFLMMSLNVKNGLSEYITNQYLKTEIDNNYNKLKLEISNIDAKIKLLNENSSKKHISFTIIFNLFISKRIFRNINTIWINTFYIRIFTI